MQYREILFEVWEPPGPDAKKYRIYANGEVEGFPGGSMVVNRYGMVRDALLRRYASENGIEFDPDWPRNSSTDSLVGGGHSTRLKGATSLVDSSAALGEK